MTRRQGVFLMAVGFLASLTGGELSRLSTAATVRPRTQVVRPLSFEENVGQLDARARFVARTPSYSLFFTEREAVLLSGQDVVRLQFDRASPRTRLVPAEPLVAKTNYLIGNDSSRWKTGISNYAKLRYEELYPGIDLVFYGNNRELEYDMVVTPGTDPSIVRMSLDGARDLAVAGNGDLVGHAAAGEIRIVGKPASSAAALARVTEVVAQAGGRPVSAFTLTDSTPCRGPVTPWKPSSPTPS